MKNIYKYLFVFLLAFPLTSHAADTVYTSSADEFSAELYRINSEISMFSDEPAEPFSERTLLVNKNGELDDRGAYEDICTSYGIHLLRYATAAEADSAYEYYKSMGYAVSYDMEISICNTGAANYPYFTWGAEYIGAKEFNTGLTTKFGPYNNMPEIKVAVIDTGIDYTHPLLKNRIADGGYNFITNSGDANAAADDQGHGTHVSGTIADLTFYNVKIVPFKILDSEGHGDISHLTTAIQKAIELGVNVINMSLGTDKEDSLQSLKATYEPLFNAAAERGIVLCSAAGNDAFNSDNIFPAYMNDTITVSNITSNGTLNSTSGRGSVVDIAAPGTNILSAYPDFEGTNTSETSFTAARMSGTSMACPHVSAAAAMLLTKNISLSASEVEELITSNAIDLGDEGKDIYFGYGALNMRGYFLEKPQIAAASLSSDGSSVNITFENDGGDLKNSALLIAAGFKNKRFVCFQSADIISADAKTLSDTAFSDCDLIKVFAWDSLSDMNPVSDIKTIPQ